MRTYTLEAFAKINLYLEIVGDRPDGYHELVMIMQSVGLGDRITLRPNGLEEFRLICPHPLVPGDASNLAHRAAMLMASRFPEKFANYGGLDINIEKNIPVAAGLAGGSADAAAVLVGIDLVWDLGLTRAELQSLAGLLGSDIPFCIAGGTVMATGRGEILDPIVPVENLWVVLAKYESLAVSTPWAYRTYRERFHHEYTTPADRNRGERVNPRLLMGAIERKDATNIGKFIYNDLERIVLPHFERVKALKEVLGRFGGLGAMMSGSGPTVFALCRSEEEAGEIHHRAAATLPDPDLKFWTAPLSNRGIQILDG